MDDSTGTSSSSLREVFLRFLRLGSVGFGGPIAMLGYIEKEFVEERRWVAPDDFHRMVAACKLFPGPLASLVSVRVGYSRAGVRGGIAAGLGQILPAFTLILIFAQASQSLDRLTWMSRLWIGLSLAAIAVSIQATVRLTRPLFNGHSPYPRPALLGIIAMSAVLTFEYPRLEAVFIVGFGLLALLRERGLRFYRSREGASALIALALFWTCFRASLFTFGSGIAIVPVLRTFFIEEHHWVTAQDFLKGLTLGQITPGPLVIVATYLGFITFGFVGAAMATIGIFLPTFFFGAWLMPRFESAILHSTKLRAFFDGLLPAVSGAIFGALARLALLSVMADGQWFTGRVAVTIVLTALAVWRNPGPLPVFLAGGAAAFFLR